MLAFIFFIWKFVLNFAFVGVATGYGFPSDIKVYWINLDRARHRKHGIENMLEAAGVNHTRVAAYDGKQFAHTISSEYVHILNNNKNGISIMYHNLTSMFVDGKKPSPEECACALSHLKAIKQAYADGNEMAVIFEDDVTFDHLPFWGNEGLSEVLLRANLLEPKWGIIQLSWIGTTLKLSSEGELDRIQLLRAYERGEIVVRRDRFPRLNRLNCGGRQLWGAMAYAIRRDYMRLILDIYWPGGSEKALVENSGSKIFSWMGSSHIMSPIQADCFIYGAMQTPERTLVVTRPLFLYPSDEKYSTTMTDRDKHDRQQFAIRRKKTHSESRSFIQLNFYDKDIAHTRIMPKLYVINTGHEGTHELWASASAVMFDIGTIVDVEVVSAFNHTDGFDSVYESGNAVYCAGRRLVAIFPRTIDHSQHGEITTYFKALRVIYGDGFPLNIITSDTLNAAAIKSLRDFNFPLAVSRLPQNWTVARLVYNGADPIGFLTTHEKIGKLLDFGPPQPGGREYADTPADGNWLLTGVVDFSQFFGTPEMNAEAFILHNILLANMPHSRMRMVDIDIMETLSI